MTKVQAVKQFKELYNREQFMGPYGRNGRMVIDDTMHRETWNNYTDTLCKDRVITQWQYDNWTNPF